MPKHSKGFVVPTIFLVLGVLIIIALFTLPNNHEECLNFPGSTSIEMVPSECVTFYGKKFIVNSKADSIIDINSVEPTNSDKQEYHQKTSYSDVLYGGPKFTLDFPPECEQIAFKDDFDREQFIINCKTDKFLITINPQSGGTGLYWQGSIIQGNIKAGNLNIEYATYISDDKTQGKKSFSHYIVSGTKNNLETDYQIEVYYDNYSENAQKYVNQIISTFKI